MTLLWTGIAIVLAINSMWLLKINKDLTQTNDELIARNIMMSLTVNEYKIPTKPVTDEQKQLLKKWYEDNEEDK